MKVTLEDGAKMPTKAYTSDAGWDLYCIEDSFIHPTLRLGYSEEGVTLFCHEKPAKVNTGVSISIPEGYYGMIAEKSGLALKGIGVVGGIIDCSFRGAIQVLLTNSTNETIKFDKGDKIAQLVIQPIFTGSLELVDQLDETDRNYSGFGSSGR